MVKNYPKIFATSRAGSQCCYAGVTTTFELCAYLTRVLYLQFIVRQKMQSSCYKK